MRKGISSPTSRTGGLPGPAGLRLLFAKEIFSPSQKHQQPLKFPKAAHKVGILWEWWWGHNEWTKELAVFKSTPEKHQFLCDCWRYSMREILKGRHSFACFLLLLQTSISLTISLIRHSSNILQFIVSGFSDWTTGWPLLLECIKGFVLGKMKCEGISKL